MIRFSILAVLVGCGLLAGCGPAPKPSGRLNGSVTFDGAPIKDVTVQLQSTKTGEAFAAKVDAGGKYSIDSPVTTGEYKVVVLPVVDVPPAGTGIAPSGKPADRKDIPERYRAMDKTELKVDVKPGDNTFDAKLTK